MTLTVKRPQASVAVQDAPQPQGPQAVELGLLHVEVDADAPFMAGHLSAVEMGKAATTLMDTKMSQDASGARLIARKRIVMHRAGRGRYQSGPTTVPRSMLKPDCQGESHSVRTYSIARHHEAGMKTASRLCDGDRSMAKQDTNRRDDNAEPLKLHSRRERDDAGVPKMTRGMEWYIAASSPMSGGVIDAEREHDELADLDEERQAVALARLEVEQPLLFGVVFLTDYRALSLRATGRHLGMDHHTVTKHRGRAIALIRAWSTDELQAG